MKNLNAGANLSQHIKRSKHNQTPRYGQRRNYRQEDVA